MLSDYMKHSRKHLELLKWLLVCCTACYVSGCAITLPTLPIAWHHRPVGSGYWHTSGSQILDEDNQPVRIAGINWFGFDTTNYTVQGLWVRSYKEMVDQIAGLGYNTIRLPYSNQLFDPGSRPDGINFKKNPELRGLNGLQIMDKIINYAGSKGLRVILDQHRPEASTQSALWYTSGYPESRWLADWRMLTQHYRGNTTIIGADLHNEPHAPACWGCGIPAVDWQQAAERAGNAILQINPHWLIFVEGVSCDGREAKDNGSCYWWGGNLKGVATKPVKLQVPDQLVYSAHDYPPSIFMQKWFDDPAYPENLTTVWDTYWGYIARQHIAPVWIGEFGTNLGTEKDRQWLTTLIQYMGKGSSGMSWTYWCLNPDSASTGGILQSDWISVDQGKQAYLRPIEFTLGKEKTADMQTGATSKK